MGLMPAFLDKLRLILNSDQLCTDPADSWLYSYDNSRHRSLPQAVVFPNTTQDVGHIIKICHEYTVALTARGRGTGTPGGSVPLNQSVVMSFEKMDKILALSSQDKWIKVQPGVLNHNVQQAAGEKGFFWAPDPGSAAFSTVGGNIAYNAAGPRAVKYGAVREHVLTLTAVTGTGEIIQTGSITSKNSTGYDLTRLLIGAEGTLAVITEATLKLTPLPDFKATFKVLFSDIKTLSDTVIKIMSQPELPCALEFLDNACLTLITQNSAENSDNLFDQGLSDQIMNQPKACLLLINIDDLKSKSLILNIIERSEYKDLKIAETEQEIKSIWALRRKLSPALRNIARKKINEDIVVPVSRVPELLYFIDELKQKYNLKILTFGHIGNGNLHVNLLADDLDMNIIKQYLSDLFDYVIFLDGTLSGEHGIGIEKKPFIDRVISQPTLDIMRNIKKVFDPRGILNPGKIFYD